LLVLAESAFVVGTGAVLGMLAGWQLSRMLVPAIRAVLPGFAFGGLAVALGAVLAAVFALLSGALPGGQAARLPVAATLRRA